MASEQSYTGEDLIHPPTRSSMSNYTWRVSRRCWNASQSLTIRGEKIGERIVGVRLDHGPQSSGKPYTFVISTDGKFYQIVSAQSLGTVLAFEKFVENSQGSARVSPGR